MSVFHRVDDLDALPAAVFLPRMVRLAVYDGAVQHTMRREAEQPSTAVSAPARTAAPVTAHSGEQMSALNQTREFGPLPGAGQSVGVFDVG